MIALRLSSLLGGSQRAVVVIDPLALFVIADRHPNFALATTK